LIPDVVRWAFVSAVAPVVLHSQVPAPSLRIVKDLHIDALQHDLEPVRELSVRPDGVIAITQFRDGTVLFFGRDGNLLSKIGRQGAGPGEFRSPHKIGWQGDSLWVHDMALNRITLLLPDRRIVRTISVPALRPNAVTGRLPVGQWSLPVAYPSPDRLLLTGIQGLAAGRQPWQRTLGNGALLVRVGASGEFQSVAAAVPSDPLCYQSIRGLDLAVPECLRTWSGFSPSGGYISVVTTTALPGRRFRTALTILSSAGDTVVGRSFDFAGERIGRGTRDSLLHAARKAYERYDDYRMAVASLDLPESHEPFKQVLLGDDRTVWLRERKRGSGTTWLQLDNRGLVVGKVALPAGTRLMVARAGLLWCLEEDDSGVESVVRYRVFG